MSLADLRPDLIKFWSEKNEYSPWEISPSSHTECCCLCPVCGCVFKRSCYSRLASARCKDCGYKLATVKQATPKYKESLGYLYPDIASTWSSRNTCTPFDVYPRSNTPKRLWICEYCGEEYSMTCANRTRRSGHKKCRLQLAGNKRSTPPKSDSLATLYPRLLSEYSPSNSRDPYSLYPQANYLAKWICPEGHEWDAWIYHRTVKNSGCPHCCNNQTSTAEENLRSALLSHGALPDSYRIGKWNVDIYFPEKKTIVEYDGSHWHHKPENYERDKRKSLELLEMGYRVVRVRTWSSKYKLETLGICSSGYDEIFIQEPINSKPTEYLVLDILHKVR